MMLRAAQAEFGADEVGKLLVAQVVKVKAINK